MENFIKKMVDFLMEKKFPFVSDIFVIKQLNFQSYYIDKEKNYKYEIFLKVPVEFEAGDKDSETTKEIRDLIKNTIKMMGIMNHVLVYFYNDES
jgi:hypothetical protein